MEQVAPAIYIPPDFKEFPKIPRLSREIVITEKIDGTNASIYIDEITGEMILGSRTRWLIYPDDNFGFAAWARQNEKELKSFLGPGLHYGEWWGKGIQRNYGLLEKRFSLFNTSRWTPENTANTCCSVVPVLYKGVFNTYQIDTVLENLKICGSAAAPNFMRPEGIIIYHIAGNLYFKKTIEKDEEPKGKVR